MNNVGNQTVWGPTDFHSIDKNATEFWNGNWLPAFFKIYIFFTNKRNSCRFGAWGQVNDRIFIFCGLFLKVTKLTCPSVPSADTIVTECAPPEESIASCAGMVMVVPSCVTMVIVPPIACISAWDRIWERKDNKYLPGKKLYIHHLSIDCTLVLQSKSTVPKYGIK